MNFAAIGFLFAILATPNASPNPRQNVASFDLYPVDNGCVCIKTKKETLTAHAIEKKIGKVTYQIFKSRNIPRRELFRVGISDDWSGEWNYGIAREADFNADGIPDYAWYGGDDTGEEKYLFLSSGNKYQRVDILRTFAAAFHLKFHKPAPDLGEADGNFGLAYLTLVHSPSGLILDGTISRLSANQTVEKTYRLRVNQANFLP